MGEISINKTKQSSLLTLLLAVLIVFGLIMSVASISNKESSPIQLKVENEDLYCSKESCKELRQRFESLEESFRERIRSVDEAFQKRVTSLEKTFHNMVSALSEDKNRHFENVNQKVGRNRPVRSAPVSPPPISSGDLQEEENQPTEKSSSSEPESHHHHQSANSNSVHHLKQAVKCSLAHMLDIHVSGSNNGNKSAGILNTTLHRHQNADKSIEIDWSPPLASCIEFITGIWIKVYESGTDSSFEPYLSIPRKCLKSKQNPSGKEALSILLPSSNSSLNHHSTDAECDFGIQSLIDCRSYQVEVVPDYQSLRGKSINAEIIVPPTLDTMNRIQSLMSVSALIDSLTLNWEDNSGCASRLTSINLRLWPDGALSSKTMATGGGTDQVKSLKISIEPIIYTIPRSCLKQVPRDGNLFTVTISSNHSSCSTVQWESLNKCRKYVLEMESQYSSSWTGPSSSQIIFTSTQQDSSRYPVDQFGTYFCTTPDSIPCNYNNKHCLSYQHVCDGRHNCIERTGSYYIDEKYCEDRHSCLSGFKCGRQCIPRELLCDGNYDCLNGEDESIDHCDYLNSCQHITSTRGTFASLEPVVNSQESDVNTRPDLVRKTTLLISVKYNQVIWVDFGNLEKDKRTKVKLYDGPYSTSPVLLSYDDTNEPPSVRTTGPNLYVEYYSYQNETSGVKAYYLAMEKKDQPEFVQGCGGYVNGAGTISSANWGNELLDDDEPAAQEYPDECFWFIEARHAGETILLKKNASLVHQKLTLDSPIVVYDSWNVASGVVLYDSNTMEKKETIYSSSSKMLVRFDRPASTKLIKDDAFWNVTTISTPYCKEHLTESSGTVNSPNYPAPYPKSSDCYWAITTAPGSAIRLLFAFFKTQEKRDFVYVYDGPTVYYPLILEKSGIVSTPFVVNSSSNQVLVRFTSDVGKPFNGFLAVYSVV